MAKAPVTKKAGKAAKASRATKAGQATKASRGKAKVGKAEPRILKCATLQAAIKRELRTQIKEKGLRDKLVEVLSGEVAYNTGGGGGIGVA